MIITLMNIQQRIIIDYHHLVITLQAVIRPKSLIQQLCYEQNHCEESAKGLKKTTLASASSASVREASLIAKYAHASNASHSLAGERG